MNVKLLINEVLKDKLLCFLMLFIVISTPVSIYVVYDLFFRPSPIPEFMGVKLCEKWDTEFHFSIVSNTAYLASAGLDGRYFTGDDIVITNQYVYSPSLIERDAQRRKDEAVVVERKRQEAVEAAVASHVYPAPVEKTTFPTAIQWIVLSLSNREPRMLRVRENGYMGASWTGDIIKSAYREFADVKFPDDQWYRLWQVDEVGS